MRQDQLERLQALSERLLDVFLDEADPEHWPGKGLKLGAMDAQTRGDLYWVRKTAAAVLVLENRVSNRIGQVQQSGSGTTPAAPSDDDAPQADDGIESELQAAEKQAAALMRELQTGTKKAAWDRKVHGKS